MGHVESPIVLLNLETTLCQSDSLNNTSLVKTNYFTQPSLLFSCRLEMKSLLVLG